MSSSFYLLYIFFLTPFFFYFEDGFSLISIRCAGNDGEEKWTDSLDLVGGERNGRKEANFSGVCVCGLSLGYKS